jgi:hypothetical protein
MQPAKRKEITSFLAQACGDLPARELVQLDREIKEIDADMFVALATHHGETQFAAVAAFSLQRQYLCTPAKTRTRGGSFLVPCVRALPAGAGAAGAGAAAPVLARVRKDSPSRPPGGR